MPEMARSAPSLLVSFRAVTLLAGMSTAGLIRRFRDSADCTSLEKRCLLSVLALLLLAADRSMDLDSDALEWGSLGLLTPFDRCLRGLPRVDPSDPVRPCVVAHVEHASTQSASLLGSMMQASPQQPKVHTTLVNWRKAGVFVFVLLKEFDAAVMISQGLFAMVTVPLSHAA